ncbi:cytidylyltransferase domain-containing protein [Bacteroidota bacterium]
MNKKIIAIIPARGGSKGIPGKNIIEVAGRPLISWSIIQAINTKSIIDVYVSTNDKEIANISKQYGAKIIWRPDELSNDVSTSESAIIHAVEYLQNRLKIKPDIIVFLQATSPLRNPTDIDNSISQFIVNEADSLISGSKFNDFLFWEERNDNWESLNYDYKNRGRRQDRKSQFVENGSIYIFKPKIIRKYNNRIGGKLILYEMDFWQTWQIDNLEDIELIEYYFTTKMKLCNTDLLKRIDLIVYDFDGVMTDNKAYIDQFGNESVLINRGDGLAISKIMKSNIRQIILSTEENTVVKKRAEKLKLNCFQGINNKKEFLMKYLDKNNINSSNVAYIGNDINDLEIMKHVGLPIAPNDACNEIKKIAKIVTIAKGGNGVIREIYNYIKTY